MRDDALLCYVDGPWAWLTTKTLSDQWGDYWDDAPYEHNAGDPYGPTVFHEDHHSDGTPKWEVFRVAWEGDFETPNAMYNDSPYSVEQINRGDVAWLRPSRYRKACAGAVPIPAGTTLADFRRMIRQGGGVVYLPEDPDARAAADALADVERRGTAGQDEGKEGMG